MEFHIYHRCGYVETGRERSFMNEPTEILVPPGVESELKKLPTFEEARREVADSEILLPGDWLQDRRYADDPKPDKPVSGILNDPPRHDSALFDREYGDDDPGILVPPGVE